MRTNANKCSDVHTKYSSTKYSTNNSFSLFLFICLKVTNKLYIVGATRSNHK